MTHKPGFFDGLLKANRKLQMDYDDSTDDQSERAVRIRSAAADFLEGYAAFNGISQKAAEASYMETMRHIVGDIRKFIATGKYPLELDPKQWEIGRTDYDLILLLSILVTRHRCAIMAEIARLRSIPGRPLVIGVGSGH